MRRRVIFFAILGLLLAGCGESKVVSPTAKTVVGPLPTTAQAVGDPAAGKSVFSAQGCSSCHTYGPAGSHGTVGPNLDNLAADATKANQGSLADYTHASIADPDAYLVPGFPKGVMPSYGNQLSDQQIADLVAFLTKP